MTTEQLLVLMMVVFPLISAVAVWLSGYAARTTAIGLAVIHLVLTGMLVVRAVPELNARADKPVRIGYEPLFVPGSEMVGGRSLDSQRTTWTLLQMKPGSPAQPGPKMQFYLGVDGLNIWLVVLSSLMIVPAILVSWNSFTENAASYYAWLFVLQAGVIGAFLAFDLILFYVFFEITLIPSFFLIGRWGTGPSRRDAARKFFLYTLAGSLLMLVGLVGLVLTNPMPNGEITFSLPDLMRAVHTSLENAARKAGTGQVEELAVKQSTQGWIFALLMLGLAVKTPVWPLHTWLPAAYGEGHLGTTVLLSSLLSKLGTFGILRWVLALTPDAAIQYGLPVVGGFAAFSIVYAAFCAFSQRDMKLLIAYSSISHLGFLVLGVLAFNHEGLAGATLHMVNHGLTTGGLFAILGFLWDRYRTTQIASYSGLMGRFPRFAFFAFVLVLASVGLPGLNNFVSEMLILAGLADLRNPYAPGIFLLVIGAFSIFLSAWYMLTLIQKVFFNPLREPLWSEPNVRDTAANSFETDIADVKSMPSDVNSRERLMYASLCALCLGLGLFPQAILKPMQADVNKLATIGDRARDRVQGKYPSPVSSKLNRPRPKSTGQTPSKNTPSLTPQKKDSAP